ncbi:MAG: hypothetical protein OEL89_04910, partial [Candidatus Peregrinibacteria bacterium]|nr:hypothetical protein [Candidatus Peregrinibacteria bacterium]
MRKYLLILFLFPNLTFASLGEDINSILEKFWWGSDSSFEPETVPEIKTEKVDIPETFSSDEIRDEILLEEGSLADFEEKIFQKEQELWSSRTEKNSAQTDLFLLDSEVTILTDKLNKLVEQEQKWKSDLERLTRGNSDINAAIRVEKRELDNYLAKNFVRSENFGTEENVSVLKWLFSSKTVAEILEENNRKRSFESEKKKRITVLENLKKDLDLQEKNVAFLFKKVSNLTQKVATSKQNLSEFSRAKANIIARLEFDEGTTLTELENYRRNQAESTIILQNLRVALDDAEDEEY